MIVCIIALAESSTSSNSFVSLHLEILSQSSLTVILELCLWVLLTNNRSSLSISLTWTEIFLCGFVFSNFIDKNISKNVLQISLRQKQLWKFGIKIQIRSKFHFRVKFLNVYCKYATWFLELSEKFGQISVLYQSFYCILLFTCLVSPFLNMSWIFLRAIPPHRLIYSLNSNDKYFTLLPQQNI